MSDDFDLQRFVDAQDFKSTIDRATAELRSGRKLTHWMWFVFPQLVGLGHSPTAKRYGISGLAEARAYLHHRVLGSRLLDCAHILTQLPEHDPFVIFGAADTPKLRSSMTLFSQADPLAQKFSEVLTRYFGGEADKLTIDLL